jgi:hypothetical protein
LGFNFGKLWGILKIIAVWNFSYKKNYSKIEEIEKLWVMANFIKIQEIIAVYKNYSKFKQKLEL